MNRDFLRQAQQLQAKLAKAQEELAQSTVEASAGGGAVTVVMGGDQKVKSIKIDPQAVDPQEVELLEDMIMAALNEAQEKVQELAQSRLGALTGGLNIPGLR
ncbi:MAG: YbaB/EbfC family nucleoid-associated protein [Chloroflexi bacterium]|nr:YbaB/EbfC family nucleoid-associated protein [Chloroflexota bacterium]